MKKTFFALLGLFLLTGLALAKDEGSVEANVGTVEKDLGASREGSRTDDELLKREEEAVKLDSLNVAQLKEIRDKAEKFTFQTEVNRMMKLIINSLYRNKEIFLRELISNASDALDKIRLLSLTDKNVLDTNPEMSIRIKVDKENKILSITDTGIGMTKEELVSNLGTIAKSGTAEFLGKMQDAKSSQEMNDMIGQFGVGFYSAFLIADTVVVTTKHNKDKQYVWESDSSSYTIAEDPRGNTLKRGTTISLHLKDEASDFLEEDTIKNLIKKYSQFINFNIYLWCSKTIEVDEEEEVKPEAEKPEVEETESKESEAEKSEEKKSEAEESEAEKSEDDEDEEVNTEDEDEDGKVEEVKEEKPKKKIKKTIWDWELLNDSKPIWTLKPSDITDAEYNEFYKSLTKDKEDPLAKIHFIAEGEVTFKSLLFIPKVQPSESLSRYGTKGENIKLYVRRVFITDKFSDMMPNYLAFIRGIVDSDDLPLNVSRENLQQHKLIKIIKKKLIRKVLDMIKKISKEDYDAFWKEYSTNIKLGVIEDSANRARLSKLLKFKSSKEKEQTFLSDYVSRMKPTQRYIYYLGGITEEEIRKSPFVERLIKKGYEVLFLTEAVDEHAIVTIPEFEGKRFHNIAKEGFVLDESPEAQQKLHELKSTFEPLTKWLDDVLKDYVSKSQISERLSESPCALIASYFGWTGNMERLASSNAHKKAEDSQASHYLSQKKTMEINPRHPLIKELLRRVEDDSNDQTAKDIALLMFKTATLRSGYMLRETHSYARSVEQLMKKSLGIPVDEAPEEEDDDLPEESAPSEEGEEADEEKEDEEHDEL